MKTFALSALGTIFSASGLFAEYHGKMADLRFPAREIGTDWSGPSGVIQEKGQPLPLPPDVAAKMGDQLKNLPPATADASYYKNDGKTIITIQLYYFASKADAAEKFKKLAATRKKDGEFVKIDGFGDEAFDYKNIQKRIVLVDNMMVTLLQMPEGGEGVKILNKYIEAIRNPESRKASP